MSNGIERIAAERKRQVEKEGYDADHDIEHGYSELAWAAVCYAAPETIRRYHLGDWFEPWPWDAVWDKRFQHSRLRRLQIAGALIAAEIDRLLALEPGNG